MASLPARSPAGLLHFGDRRMDAMFVGLMSGTSMDGVDGVLVHFGDRHDAPTLAVLAHAHRAFPADLASQLLTLNASGPDELHRAALAGNALARLYAAVVTDLLVAAEVPARSVVAIGAHGQTVRHRPGEFDATGYTLQINNAALLAELTGIDVVADFRSRDVAAGGQGAPLVPAFHQAFFGRSERPIGVLNIGGISNLSVLSAEDATQGFDCGPGNVLMDLWCQTHLATPYDHNGDWAASGTVDQALLSRLQGEPYFQRRAPKSTGRDLFHSQWLAEHLSAAGLTPVAQDVQATLAELTAWCCAQALLEHAPDASALLVCGGGAYNAHLMARLAKRLPAVQVESTAARGLPADQVEATAFAWLAKAFVDRQPGNLARVTGASGPRILGALYPATVPSSAA